MREPGAEEVPVAAQRSGRVALVGRPNVGKSTLLNYLLGETWSIASHHPQTTRSCILGTRSGPGFQITYVDTPGLQSRYGGELNRRMRRTVVSALNDTAAVVFLVEALRWHAGADALVLEALRAVDVPVLLAINKIDKITPKDLLLPFMEKLATLHGYAEIVPVSARTGAQVDVLERCIITHLPVVDTAAVAPVESPPLDERRLAAELLRAELLYRLGDEIPHRLSVRVERLEHTQDVIHVHAVIWVETEGQKRIVVGSEGGVLKAAGSRARARLEPRWGRQVCLKTHVRVVRNWSDSVARLEELAHG